MQKIQLNELYTSSYTPGWYLPTKIQHEEAWPRLVGSTWVILSLNKVEKKARSSTAVSPWWSKSRGRCILCTKSHRNSRLPLPPNMFIDTVPGFWACLLSSTEYCEHVKTVSWPLLLAPSVEHQETLSPKTSFWACNDTNSAYRGD